MKVADIKKLIETTQGQNVHPADGQVFIHQGKVLKDETTLEENKVLENDFIIIALCKGKSNMCDFIEWKDDKCLAMFQEVAANIWEVVDNFKKKADDLQVDLLAEIQLRNEMYEEKEALMSEKEDWARQKENLIMEKERLERELTMRTLLAQTSCSTLENRIRSDGYDKKMLYGFILCLLGLMVAILFGLILKNK
ncbi:hypothetical protein SETIT_6G155400v2 [Setaria italica]|uniref:Ubiquitin-like domain-containing protein n=1 Tax=Setaria italica TaxID=4555 RepID=A0A368RLT9_SETIT|nr:hypothetical protein SETIT_6G155400v2 [Setaria italica]